MLQVQQVRIYSSNTAQILYRGNMDIKRFLLAIFLIVIIATIAEAAANYASFKHPAFQIGDGKWINLSNQGIGNGQMENITCIGNCTGFTATSVSTEANATNLTIGHVAAARLDTIFYNATDSFLRNTSVYAKSSNITITKNANGSIDIDSVSASSPLSGTASGNIDMGGYNLTNTTDLNSTTSLTVGTRHSTNVAYVDFFKNSSNNATISRLSLADMIGAPQILVGNDACCGVQLTYFPRDYNTTGSLNYRDAGVLRTEAQGTGGLLVATGDQAGTSYPVFIFPGDDGKKFPIVRISNTSSSAPASIVKSTVLINQSNPAVDVLRLRNQSDDSFLGFTSASGAFRIAATYDTTGSFQPIEVLTSDGVVFRLNVNGTTEIKLGGSMRQIGMYANGTLYAIS